MAAPTHKTRKTYKDHTAVAITRNEIVKAGTRDTGFGELAKTRLPWQHYEKPVSRGAIQKEG